MGNLPKVKPPKLPEQIERADKFLRYREQQEGVVEAEQNGVRSLVARVVERAQQEQLFAEALGGVLTLEVLVNWADSLQQLGGIELLDKKHPYLRNGHSLGSTDLYGGIDLRHNDKMFDSKAVLEMLATNGLPEDFLTLFHELIHRLQKISRYQPVGQKVVDDAKNEVNQKHQAITKEFRAIIPLIAAMATIFTVGTSVKMEFYQRMLLFLAGIAMGIFKVSTLQSAIKGFQEPVKLNFPQPEGGPFLNHVIGEIQAYRAMAELGLDHQLDLLDGQLLVIRLIASDLFYDAERNPINQEQLGPALATIIQIAPKIAILRSLKVSHQEIAKLLTSSRDEKEVIASLQAKIDELSAAGTSDVEAFDVRQIVEKQGVKRDQDVARLKSIAREEITAVLRSPEYVEYVKKRRRDVARRR